MKDLLQKIFVNDLSWKLFSPFIQIAERLKASRKNYLERADLNRLSREASMLFPEKKVVYGPFKGMLLGDIQPGGSSYFAKLLGSYETEIHPFIDASFKENYEKIVNIGCDEGYYAVGYAMKFKDAIVEAYDISATATKKCKLLAENNGVGERVITKGKFSASDIGEPEKKFKSFYLVDCEGDERHIFNDSNIQYLEKADLLIELHLHTDSSIPEYLINLFKNTHHYELANSVDDYLKATTYQYPLLNNQSFELKKFITEEREVFMQWILLKAKSGD